MKFTENTLKRAARTFFQAVVAYLIIALRSGVDIYDKEAVKGLIAGLIAAGISALMNLEKTEVGGEGEALFYYNQNDYSGVSYSKPDGTYKTIKTSGCGVVSACIALNTLAGRELYNVYEMANFSKSCGARVNSGTDENKLLTALCKAEKGFSFKTGRDVDALLKHLKNGGVAICNQGGGYNVFSTSGHYVVAYKESGGNIFVADPSNTPSKYDKFSRPQRIVKKTDYGCVVKPCEMKKATADRYPSYYLISYSENKEVKYFKKCDKGAVSIADALYSIGENGSYKSRKLIAKANGIKGYIGSAKQNTKLLSLLKNGKLIKP